MSNARQSIYHARFLTSLIFIVTLFFILLSPVSAQTTGTTVRPDPPTFEIGVGQVETINIVLENAKDAYGIEVRAKFDTSVIEVVDSDPNQDGVQMIPGAFIKPDFLVRNTADNQKGTLQYVITQVNPSTPVSGNGIVFSIQFRGKTLGKKTTLAIDFVDIADRQGRKLPVRGQNQTITVGQPKPPTPTATLAATPTSVASITPARTTPTPLVTPVSEGSTRSVRPDPGLFGFSNLEIIVILIACAGFFGTFVLVIVAIVVMVWRKSRARRAVERNYPQW